MIACIARRLGTLIRNICSGSQGRQGDRRMLLESLCGTLTHLRALQETLDAESDVIDPVNFGRTVTAAFVVGLRSELTQPEKGRMAFVSVGSLEWNGETVVLKHDDNLRRDSEAQHVSLFWEYLSTWHEFSGDGNFFDLAELQYSEFWRDLTLAEVFQNFKSTEPYPGHEFITAICSLLVRARMAKDPDLRLTLKHVTTDEKEMHKALDRTADILSFLVHDAICSGHGLRIETIGTFRPRPDLDFSPDKDLISLAQAWHQRKAKISSEGYHTSLK